MTVKLFRCVVDRAPYGRNGKTYAALDLVDAFGDLAVLRQVDEFIERAAAPEFSPLRAPLVIVKVPDDLRFHDDRGEPGEPFALDRGVEVDAVLRLGAFGGFGYCWLLERVKPAAAVLPDSAHEHVDAS